MQGSRSLACWLEPGLTSPDRVRSHRCRQRRKWSHRSWPERTPAETRGGAGRRNGARRCCPSRWRLVRQWGAPGHLESRPVGVIFASRVEWRVRCLLAREGRFTGAQRPTSVQSWGCSACCVSRAFTRRAHHHHSSGLHPTRRPWHAKQRRSRTRRLERRHRAAERLRVLRRARWRAWKTRCEPSTKPLTTRNIITSSDCCATPPTRWICPQGLLRTTIR
jgi:hypothetical protein